MQLTQRKSSLIIVFNYITMVLIWGSFPVVTKIGVEHAPPLLLSGIRFTLAFLIMAPFAYWQSKKKLWITWRQHVQVFTISLLMVAIPSSIFFAATPHAPVSVLTIMWSTTPIFTALFSMRDTGEVHNWKLPVSLLIGLTGVLIVLLGRIPFFPGSSNSPLFAGGIALIFELAVLASSSIYGYGIRMARRKSPDIPVTVMTAWQLFYCSVFLLTMSLIFERGEPFQPTWVTFGVLFYLAIFCSCISFFLVFWLIRRIGAIRTAYSDFLIPGVTLILSALFVGESLTIAKVIGLVFVILGVILVQIP